MDDKELKNLTSESNPEDFPEIWVANEKVTVDFGQFGEFEIDLDSIINKHIFCYLMGISGARIEGYTPGDETFYTFSNESGRELSFCATVMDRSNAQFIAPVRKMLEVEMELDDEDHPETKGILNELKNIIQEFEEKINKNG